jgi:amidohydrolase
MTTSMNDLATAIDGIHDDLVALRHHLHRYPEPGFEERETQARLRDELAACGIAARDCAGTGLVADIGHGDGPVIALRADIDCLRMTEENPELPYRSTRAGLAHMCGHDGHMAMLMGAARLLAGHGDRLPGTVRLLFQPAEEGPGGAPVMIEEGALAGVDEIYGLHNWPGFPLGTLRTVTGACMATVAIFEITVHGKGGHAAQPQQAIDPVLAAAHVVTALQSIVARNVHYQESAVISTTCVHGGEIHNVIPDTVRLTGTIRALSDPIYQLIEERIGAVATQTAAAFGARAECSFERMYPVLVNHPAATEHVLRVGRSLLGESQVTGDELPMMTAEDFAYFTRERAGCYFFLGSGESERTNAMCHATDFDFNDRLITTGVSMWIRLVEDRLGTQLYR